MKIETKYNVGDNLYFLENNEVVIKEIVDIETWSNTNITNIKYGYHLYPPSVMGSNPLKHVNEKNAFFTKEELINSFSWLYPDVKYCKGK